MGILLLPGIVEAQWIKTGATPGTLYSFIARDTDLIAETYTTGDSDRTGILLSADKGASWKKISASLPKSETVLQPVACGGKIFAATEHNGGFVSNDRGETWSAVFSPQDSEAAGMAYAEFYASQSLLYLTNSLVARLSRDCGESWSPVFPGWSGTEYLDKFAMNDSLMLVSTLPHSNGRPAHIYLSKNSGQTWNVSDSGLPAGSSVASLAISHGVCLAAMGNNGVYRSVNPGQSWSTPSSGTIPFGAASLFVLGKGVFAAGGSNVYYSEDDGETWTQVSSGLPSLFSAWQLASDGKNLFLATRDSGVWVRPLPEIDPVLGVRPNVKSGFGFRGNAMGMLRPGDDILFSTERRGQVVLRILDPMGRIVATLLNAELEPGTHRAGLPGQGLRTGIYFLELKSPWGARSRRCLLNR